MLVEIGHAALILAMMVALTCSALPLLARGFGDGVRRLASPLALLQFILVSTAFAALINAYASSDFTVANVVLNSHSEKPLLFKITGSWGNHEGSMTLWIWVLALYGAALAFSHMRDHVLQERTLIVQSLILAGFIAFILFTSNPFLRVFPAPADGNDLNPLLQDIGLALHPPLLYTGYVGFSLVFAFAVAGLVGRKIDAAWAQSVQPWILAAWTTLTLGIALGSWWAYRELGWGGWWFWDPVENVSLLPWLTGTALLHSNIVLIRRGAFARWVALLAILTFAMSLIGTFIVRSGLIMSVHSFTSDPLRGYAILAYIGTAVGAALFLYARTPLAQGNSTRLLSREGAILANNLLLLTLAFTILLTILTPLFLTLMGKPSFTVGAPYFNSIFFPIAAPIVLLAGFAPLMPWGAFPSVRARQAVSSLVCFALAGAACGFLLFDRQVWLGMLGTAFTAWLISATFLQALMRWRAMPAITGETRVQRIRRYPALALGGLLAHLGLALLCGAITVSSLLKEHYEAAIPADGRLTFGAYTLQLEKTSKLDAHTYTARRAEFRVEKDGIPLARMTPEIRSYNVRGMETSEVSLSSNPLRDIYLVIGQSGMKGEEPSIIARFYIMPGMTVLWLGFALMALGGGIACHAHICRGPKQ